jgi:UDP-sulfoquinovose synthase
MRIFIAGIDGYLGWPLAQRLGARGHVVGGADGFQRRQWVGEVGGDSVTPILPMPDRMAAYGQLIGSPLAFYEGDVRSYEFVHDAVRDFAPDAIVHLAEIPSAPFSMIDAGHAVLTQTNNIVGTLNILFAMKAVCPHAHLVKLGTMGEYGTPNVCIPEGFFEIEYRGRKDTLPFPRQAGSWYHWSKVHDSNNVMFACRIWGLRSTDIMQGVVFGTRAEDDGADPRLATRFDIDQCFGTVINRFCAQAVVGHPLTPFGKGHQRRGFLPLRDSMQCLTLALEDPPKTGEYRVFNQFAEVYGVTELAEMVQRAAREVGFHVDVVPIENPRLEREEHFYQPDHERLRALGYRPAGDIRDEMRAMIAELARHRDRIGQMRDLLVPDIRWDGSRRKSGIIGGQQT